MRARNIKPGFFRNEELAELPFGCRMLFIGLWTIADREGRLEDRPKRIAADIFPFDRDVNVEEWLQLLASGVDPFIVRYLHGNSRYISIPKWHKHQNPHVKESASTIPAPDKHSASTVQAPEETGTSPADSLIPDSLIPDSGFPLPAESGANGAPPSPKPDSSLPSAREVLESARKIRVIDSPPAFAADETYQPVVELARQFWPDSLTEDFIQAHHAWRIMPHDDRQICIDNLRRRIDLGEDSRFVSKTFARYLASPEWKRKPREPTQAKTPPSKLEQRSGEMRRAMLED